MTIKALKPKMKVYLSKSNQVSMDILFKVREHLSRFDIDLVEFNGGVYSNKPLLECEYLLILKPTNSSNYIGKGQYTQISDFVDEYTYDQVLVIEDFSYGESFKKIKNIYVSSLSSIGIVDSTNWTKHSLVGTDGSRISLEYGGIFNLKSQNNPENIDNKFVEKSDAVITVPRYHINLLLASSAS